MSDRRYLTKSRFKLACECPTKLFYTKKPEYADQNLDDSFLLALANGGFQVGELAKSFFPGGEEIETLDYADALEQTEKILRNDKAIIFEAAIAFEDYFIRADVLVKDGGHIDLIEVKSKSADSSQLPFTNKNGTISSAWTSYLYDVAFQKYVLLNASPGYTVSAYLMLADRSVPCPTDGLNQKFYVATGMDGRKRTKVVRLVTDEDLTPPILCKINVDDLCDQVYETAAGQDESGRGFIARAALYADHYARDERIISPPQKGCKKCEFRTADGDEVAGLQSGFRECWTAKFGWTAADFSQPSVLNIWNYHFKRTESRFAESRLKMSELVEDDISPKTDGKPGVSQSERQWLQVRKAVENDTSVWIDRDGLAEEIRSWKYPLHFIDFETSMAAIPFNRGRRPYEGVAFQFSHHVVTKDGSVSHQGEYINTEPGQFPNYNFVRALPINGLPGVWGGSFSC
jgi:hypothetical protein